MSEVQFRSDMTVDLIRHSARDADVVFAARVSTMGDQSLESVDADPAQARGLINYLLRSQHGSPFEHNSMTFYVEAPIFVLREFMRHRIGMSYNEESGRYRELEPVFYVPGFGRKLAQVGRAAHPQFVDGTLDQAIVVGHEIRQASQQAYEAYKRLLGAGIAREVARMVLPVNLYSSMYVTCNARSLMHFLSLRIYDPGAAFPSYPQREIEMVAEKMEDHWAGLMPLTHDAYTGAGRVAP